jgi:Fe2+ or Zn2+ uptake regulation protein
LEILKYLDENRIHPTVDDIYSDLKEKNPSLSKTTVYNSLETLIENHIIQKLNITETESRYEFDNKMHHHFLCKKCANIIDINIVCPNIGKILKNGRKVEEVHGYFIGICKNCIEKE